MNHDFLCKCGHTFVNHGCRFDSQDNLWPMACMVEECRNCPEFNPDNLATLELLSNVK